MSIAAGAQRPGDGASREFRGGAQRRQRPMVAADVATFPLDDGLVLYDLRSGQAHLLNSSATQLWHLCDGTRTVARLARDAADLFGISYRRALSDVRDLVTEMHHADIIYLR